MAKQKDKKPKEKEKRTHFTAQEREFLIDSIYCDIINGVSMYHIRRKLRNGQYPTENGDFYPPLKKSASLDIPKEAYERLSESDKARPAELEERKRMYRERLLNLYNESYKVNDFRNALASLKELAKCEGVDEPDKLELSGNIEETVNITFGF